MRGFFEAAVTAESAAGTGTLGIHCLSTDEVTPVNARAAQKMLRAKKTLKDFFKVRAMPWQGRMSTF